MKTVALAVALVSMAGLSAVAADQEILGRSLLISDPSDAPEKHRISIVGRQPTASLPAISDPTTGGALLTVVANGGTSSSQTYLLDAAGWRAIGTMGFRYVGPTGPDGDPVKRVHIRRATNGTVLLKVTLRETVGTQPIDVVPPNPGSDGGLVLDIAGGDRYCVTLGGAAGGAVRRDTAEQWRIVRATATAGCPSIVTTTSTSTTSTTLCLPDGIYFNPSAPPGPACCSGGTCDPVGPSSCGCGAPCDSHPFPMCSGAPCYLSDPLTPYLGCIEVRVVTESGTTDQCGCLPATVECSPPCPCPGGQICQFDFTTFTCGCVPL